MSQGYEFPSGAVRRAFVLPDAQRGRGWWWLLAGLASLAVAALLYWL